MCNGRVITLINYVEMFSLLGVLNMEGRVWFEDKPFRYIDSHTLQSLLLLPSSIPRLPEIWISIVAI